MHALQLAKHNLVLFTLSTLRRRTRASSSSSESAASSSLVTPPPPSASPSLPSVPASTPASTPAPAPAPAPAPTPSTATFAGGTIAVAMDEWCEPAVELYRVLVAGYGSACVYRDRCVAMMPTGCAVRSGGDDTSGTPASGGGRRFGRLRNSLHKPTHQTKSVSNSRAFPPNQSLSRPYNGILVLGDRSMSSSWWFIASGTASS